MHRSSQSQNSTSAEQTSLTVAFIAVGCIFVVCCVFAAILLFVRNRKKQTPDESRMANLANLSQIEADFSTALQNDTESDFATYAPIGALFDEKHYDEVDIDAMQARNEHYVAISQL